MTRRKREQRGAGKKAATTAEQDQGWVPRTEGPRDGHTGSVHQAEGPLGCRRFRHRTGCEAGSGLLGWNGRLGTGGVSPENCSSHLGCLEESGVRTEVGVGSHTHLGAAPATPQPWVS